MATPPFKVKALYEYASGHDDDLGFPVGQIITVTEEEDDDWYFGTYTEGSGEVKEGLFPKNFVEKYEPAAPPRPTRTRTKKEVEQAPPAPVTEPEEPAVEPEVEIEQPKEEASAPEPPLQLPKVEDPPAQPIEEVKPVPEVKAASQPVSKPVAVSKPPPPATAEKPSSFRDRIAAFNKPAAAPVTPFKPSGSGGSSFIKKPFVAPPPSKNAYVPPPRDIPPPAIYKREHDQRAPDASSEISHDEPTKTEMAEEEQPKATSLKERIALLQKQQLEQQARHAEAAAKKAKPQRPPKKREPLEQPVEEAAPAADLEKTPTTETIGRKSMEDSLDDEAPPAGTAVPAMQHVMSPPLPSRELASDTNDADDSGIEDTEEAGEVSTGKEDIDEASTRRPSSDNQVASEVAEKETNDDADEEDDDDEEVDPEIKRRMEIRARMAKMSGGMGMMGMFGPPGGMPGMPASGPKKSKASGDSQRKSSAHEETSPVDRAPPVPIMALPGMSKVKSPEPVEPEVEREESEDETPISRQHDAEELPDVEDISTAPTVRSPRASMDRSRAPPPLPQDRAVPPIPPTASRPPPPPAPESRAVPPPPRNLRSPDAGEESDDELSRNASKLSLAIPHDGEELAEQTQGRSPHDALSRQPLDARSPISPPSTTAEKRQSRPPPPIPGLSSPTLSGGRAPPPLPPPGPPRRGTNDRNSLQAPNLKLDNPSEGEVTEYDGDYDTDIASGDKHKDALKAHSHDESHADDSITSAAIVQSPTSPISPPSARPPIPQGAPRGVPPPPPSQPPKHTRGSSDMPRMPPPPPPPAKDDSGPEDDEEYDPYRYNAPRQVSSSSTKPRVPAMPPVPAPPPPMPSRSEDEGDEDEDEDEEDYPTYPPSSAPPPPPPVERGAPPPPPSQPPAAPPQAPPQLPPQPPPSGRKSLDASRTLSHTRRSMDTSRPTVEQGFIAEEVDLAESTIWWSAPNTPPPVFQNRRDLRFEIEESPIIDDSGQSFISKDIYVLFMDYSQTIVTVVYDPRKPSNVSTIEQRHEPPPPRLRQDQLENAHTRYGTQLSEAVTAKQNSVVGDGSSHGLVTSLLPTGALSPVGTRAYGALVYANLANASTQQFDEIRAGDIITFRNTRFQGHKGTMHQKYNVEVGKPDHVGIVVDWDGTKKKIRAWEQGRENKKVKMESFRLEDLRSGEVKVWRVMGKDWVGWGTA